MSSLPERARSFATAAHRHIDHRRKYTGKPYEVHLRAVARMVSAVTDDEEMVAAAWLHDTVEDTQVTLEQVVAAFGPSVARLVEELTDVSRPGDGARTVRKTMDRAHLAGASPRAKTVKLADLIDNTRDIATHAPAFARIYIPEVLALLEVLQEGDPLLLARATRVAHRAAAAVGIGAGPTATEPHPSGDE
jgi:(p)ppGpp synthase/HD superfamily hydrolase